MTAGTLTRALLVTQGFPCFSRICKHCQCRCRSLGQTQPRAASRRYACRAGSVLAALGKNTEYLACIAFDQVYLRAVGVINTVASTLDYDLQRIYRAASSCLWDWRCSFVLKLFSTLCLFLQKQRCVPIKAVVGAQGYP